MISLGRKRLILVAAFLPLAVASFLRGDPVTPVFDTFGDLGVATFGGTGIPTDPTAIKTISDGGNTITLGLTAFNRHENPPLGNDNNGTFFAGIGTNYGDPATPTQPKPVSPSNFLGSTWNFGFYFNATGGSYTYKLLYGPDESSLFEINPALIADNQPTANTGGQNSQNLLFGGFGGVTNPFIGYNPNSSGIYSFVLQAFDGETLLGETSINVNVVPDAASTVMLLGAGMLGLVAFARHKRGAVR